MNRKYLLVVPLSFIAFISLGLPDGLMGVAWPGISKEFAIPLDYAGILLLTSMGGYIVSSFFSPVITRKLGIGGLLAASCALTATGLLFYGIASFWLIFIPFSFFLGTGAGAIDAGINTYIAQNHSERLMHWLHASFGIGITIGPLIMTYGIRFTDTWRTGYYITAAAQFILAIIFFMKRSQWEKPADNIAETGKAETKDSSIMETLKIIPAYLSMLLFLLYTGVELGFGFWIFTLLTEARGIDLQTAGVVTSLYWGSFTAGRVLAGLITKAVSGTKLLVLAMITAIAGLLLVILNLNSYATISGAILLGFSLAPIFPGLVSDTEARVGRSHQANTIGMQLAAAGVGASALPALAGMIAQKYSLEMIPITLFISLVLLFICFILSHLFGRGKK
ncbi:MAG: MFS transporter [Spirochaetes bacterium]|nr:MFS transporter [Spirochaetota bacterium]MBN2769691.1 MFS transporter [Spirochaetota bacterium]